MSPHHWSHHRVRKRNLRLFFNSRAPTGGESQITSRRERAAARQKRRARKHLERVRGGSELRQPLKLSRIVPIGTAVSVAIGALFGTPIVATARSWITGEPVRIEALSIRGAQRLSPDEIATASGLPRSARFDGIDTGKLVRNLVEHPWIADASAVVLPTSRLLIRVTERIPRAVVATGSHEGLWVVEASGLPFAAASQVDIASLPTLIATTPLAPNIADVALAQAVALGEKLRALGLPAPTEIRLPATDDPEGYSIRLPIWRARIVLGHDDLDGRLESLVWLVGSDREEITSADTIDLRFAEQAVLRSAPSSQGTKQAAARRGRAEPSEARPTG